MKSVSFVLCFLSYLFTGRPIYVVVMFQLLGLYLVCIGFVLTLF